MDWEGEFRWKVSRANDNLRGEGTAPWEVVMEEVIRLRNELAKKGLVDQNPK